MAGCLCSEQKSQQHLDKVRMVNVWLCDFPVGTQIAYITQNIAYIT